MTPLLLLLSLVHLTASVSCTTLVDGGVILYNTANNKIASYPPGHALEATDTCGAFLAEPLLTLCDVANATRLRRREGITYALLPSNGVYEVQADPTKGYFYEGPPAWPGDAAGFDVSPAGCFLLALSEGGLLEACPGEAPRMLVEHMFLQDVVWTPGAGILASIQGSSSLINDSGEVVAVGLRPEVRLTALAESLVVRERDSGALEISTVPYLQLRSAGVLSFGEPSFDGNLPQLTATKCYSRGELVSPIVVDRSTKRERAFALRAALSCVVLVAGFYLVARALSAFGRSKDGWMIPLLVLSSLLLWVSPWTSYRTDGATHVHRYALWFTVDEQAALQFSERTYLYPYPVDLPTALFRAAAVIDLSGSLFAHDVNARRLSYWCLTFSSGILTVSQVVYNDCGWTPSGVFSLYLWFRLATLTVNASQVFRTSLSIFAKKGLAMEQGAKPRSKTPWAAISTA